MRWRVWYTYSTRSLPRTNQVGSKPNVATVPGSCVRSHASVDTRHFLQRSGLVRRWTLFSWWKVRQPQSTNFSNVTYWSKITYAANLGRFFIPASLNSFHQSVWRLLPIERRANLLGRSAGSFRLPMTSLAIVEKPGEVQRLLQLAASARVYGRRKKSSLFSQTSTFSGQIFKKKSIYFVC